MSLFPSFKPTRRSSSPTWSVYDEHWGDDEEQPLITSAHASPGQASSTCKKSYAGRFTYISYPTFESTLKGCGLKKKEPIRRGAQGAVYAAYDSSSSLLTQATGGEAHVDPAVEESVVTRCDARQPTRPLVAVKRIFVQSNDYGSRDIAATVLREVTLHRFVCAQQDRFLVEAKDAVTALSACEAAEEEGRNSSEREEEEEALQQVRSKKVLIDDTARMLHLHRIVEAPHKEMCLVLEMAATNLERLLAPPAGLGGAARKKPGTVTLFGRLPAANTDEPSRGRSSGLSAPVAPATRLGNVRCPLLSQMPLVRYVMRRLLRLVCFLHEECGVVHRDLKPSNVLVVDDGGLRLGDFGSARFVPPSAGSALAGGKTAATAVVLECTPPSMRTTLHYRPPEVLFGDQSCRPAGDVWALGVMFAQLLLQKNLFHAESELDLLGAIQKLLGMPAKTPAWVKPAASMPPVDAGVESRHCGDEDDQAGGGDASSRPPFTPAMAVQASLPYKLHAGIVPAEGLDLVTRMLHQLPEYRLTVREAMAHPFLNPGGANKAAATAEDDKTGEMLWRQKVTQFLRSGVSTANVSGRLFDELGLRQPVLLGLGCDDEEDEEEEESEGDDVGGAAPFRLNLGGDLSSL